MPVRAPVEALHPKTISVLIESNGREVIVAVYPRGCSGNIHVLQRIQRQPVECVLARHCRCVIPPPEIPSRRAKFQDNVAIPIIKLVLRKIKLAPGKIDFAIRTEHHPGGGSFRDTILSPFIGQGIKTPEQLFLG